MKDIDLVAGENSLDVQMVPIVAPPGGEILELTWKRYSGADVWHFISEPMYEHTDIIHRFKVKNTGSAVALFKVGYYQTGYGAGWYYSG
ncbi:hypothetical protein ES705_48371 [subsurface metagenome]